MRTYLVTRHDATVAWACAQGLDFVHKRHLEPLEIEPGDRVIGTLPVPLVAEILERGASFEALELDLPEAMRGRELEASDLERYGARLTPYFATRLADDPARPAIRTRPTMQPTRPVPPGEDGFTRGGRFALGFLLVSGVVLAQAWMVGAATAFVTSVATLPPGGWWPALAWGEASGRHLVLTVIGLLLSGGFAAIIYRFRHRWISSVLTRSEHVAPKRALVQGLSAIGADRKAKLKLAAELGFELLTTTKDALTKDEAAALAALGYFPWQQNLRALAAHLGQVETLRLVTSRESGAELGDFRRLLVLLLGAHRPTVTAAEGCPLDLDDPDQMAQALRDTVKSLERQGINSRDIAIDITSATKPYSIAGVVATVNQDLTFTYVNNAGRVFAYTARVQLAEF